mmetsp:Transcript_47131/g.85003  ORF Transcript_47131/g.85003 Transcript_47131/m.85003 type:complete len:207 (+) Transcript_47131:194-814(+)
MVVRGFGEPAMSVLSSSWPGASAPTSLLRPEPPKAPKRRPSVPTWVVPPFDLPVVPKAARKGSGTGSVSTGTGESVPSRKSDSDSEDLEPGPIDEEAEDEEMCMFDLDGLTGTGATAADDTADSHATGDPGLHHGFKLIECDMDVNSPEANALTSPSRRRFESQSSISDKSICESNIILGASPVLMSVLEQIALEAARFPRRQTTV